MLLYDHQNTSIVTLFFPHVIPLQKSWGIHDVNKYRSLYLLPVFSKILEKIVAEQLILFLESKRLLAENQHGFRQTISTETALKIT